MNQGFSLGGVYPGGICGGLKILGGKTGVGVFGGLKIRGGKTGVGRVYSVGLTRLPNPKGRRIRDARNSTRKDREKEAILRSVFQSWYVKHKEYYSCFILEF